MLIVVYSVRRESMYGYGGCCYFNYLVYLCGGGFGWGFGLLIVLFVLLLIFGSFYWFFSCWY